MTFSSAVPLSRLHFDEDDLARGERLTRPEDARRASAFRTWQRLALGKHLGIHSRRIALRGMGKPSLLIDGTPSRIAWSASTSSGAALVATAPPNRQLGADVERIVPFAEMDEVIATYLSSRERDELAALPQRWRLRAFYRVWTAKEALFKATLTGVSDLMREVSVTVNPGTPLILRSGVGGWTGERFRLISLPLGPAFSGAIAVSIRVGP